MIQRARVDSALLNSNFIESSMPASTHAKRLFVSTKTPGVDRQSAPDTLVFHRTLSHEFGKHEFGFLYDEQVTVPPIMKRTNTVETNISMIRDSDNSEWSRASDDTNCSQESLSYEEKETIKATRDARDLLTRCVERDGVINQYRIKCLLGFGTFGIVLKAETIKTGNVVAIKIMTKSKVHPSRMCIDPRTTKQTLLEVALLKYLPPHQNLIAYIDSWDDKECHFLVTEFGGHSWSSEPVDPVWEVPYVLLKAIPFACETPAPAQQVVPVEASEHVVIHAASCTQVVEFPREANDHSLAGLIRACGGFDSSKTSDIVIAGRPVTLEYVQRTLFRQICTAVAQLHRCGMAHRDLKDENVLVDQEFHVKLIDFGHAAFYQTRKNPSIRHFRNYGTPLFAPPEVRSGMSYIGPEADIYALGLILYEMNSGDLPQNLDEARYIPAGETIFEIGFRTGFFTEEVRDLCSWLLTPDPVGRPTIEQVLSHSWFG